MAEKRQFYGLDYIRLICFVMAFHPNCTRCCPQGLDGCQCNWAWEDCPPDNGCNGSSSSAITIEPTDSSAHGQTIEVDGGVDYGGSVAFIATDAGTFGVASIGPRDRVHIVRVDANSLEEDPLTIRTTSDLALHSGDEPGRVVSDGRGRALVALRGGGAIATIDPLSGSVVARTNVCVSPRGLAVNESNHTFEVACASGEVVSVRLADDVETKRVSLGADLDEIAMLGDVVVASSATRIFSINALGAIDSRNADHAVGALRSSGALAFVATSSSLAALTLDGSGAHTTPDSTKGAAITDIAFVGDATALVADGDALLRTSSPGDFARVGGPGLTRAVALADVAGEGVSRRVLAIQTVSPRMLVIFVASDPPLASGFEPLE